MEPGSSFLGSTAASPPTTATRRYTLLRRLAVGGMGELLLARAASARGVQKLVAIKRVRPEYASDPEFVSMFLNEARLAATLDHPNVVRTYDLVEDESSFFMVMEYLHGESLGRLLNVLSTKGERVPLSHIVVIVLGVAAGLHCAHERRGVDGRPLDIVHRDLSPGNVFITYEGGVKLLDFGIAKATSRTSITIGPSRKGKVSYMSPEQCVGADVDRRSDIFALGVVMWELCTGRRLFRGDNEFAIMNQITTTTAPPPLLLVPELPPTLSDIIVRALAPDRTVRFQTAMELHEAVEAMAQAEGLLPSGPALGRFLEETCGRREMPSADPSEEFVKRETTLVAQSAATPVVVTTPPRRWTLVLALAGGAMLGAVAVGASTAGSEPLRAEAQSPAAGADSRGSAPREGPEPDSRGSAPADAAEADSRGSAPADAAEADSRGSAPADGAEADSRGSGPVDEAEPHSRGSAPGREPTAGLAPELESENGESATPDKPRKRTTSKRGGRRRKAGSAEGERNEPVRGVDGLLPRE